MLAYLLDNGGSCPVAIERHQGSPRKTVRVQELKGIHRKNEGKNTKARRLKNSFMAKLTRVQVSPPNSNSYFVIHPLAMAIIMKQHARVKIPTTSIKNGLLVHVVCEYLACTLKGLDMSKKGGGLRTNARASNSELTAAVDGFLLLCLSEVLVLSA